MADWLGEIRVYIEKSKKHSKLNKTEVQEVISLLESLLVNNPEGANQVVNALIELHYAVSAEFFKKIFSNLATEAKTDLVRKLLSAEKMAKNQNNFGIYRGLVVVNQLLHTSDNDEHIHSILKFCAQSAMGKDGGQKAGELLVKICFESTKDRLLSFDYSTWLDNELRVLAQWYDSAVAVSNDSTIKNTVDVFKTKYGLPTNKKVDIVISPGPSGESKDSSLVPSVSKNAVNPPIVKREKAVELANDLQLEIGKIINERIRLSKEIDEIQGRLDRANNERESLANQLAETFSRNTQLQNDIVVKQQELKNANNEITELENRLKNSFRADKLQHNQELAALRNELAKRLMTPYEDFKNLAAKQATQDYYEALVGVLEDVFRLLNKNGIVVQK